MAHQAVNTKQKLFEYKRKQLNDFFMDKMNSKLFIEASHKSNMVKYEKTMDELKAKVFDAFHEAVKKLES